MQQDTHEIIEYVGEQDLQAVTGGCGGCAALGSYAQTLSDQSRDHADRLSQTVPRTASEEREKANKFAQLADEARKSEKISPIPNCQHCNNFPHLMDRVGAGALLRH